MLSGPFAYAFGLGLVATVNPCGFAMLPAYLSYFLGIDSAEPAERSVRRALAVGMTLTAGFVVVFAIVGFVIENISHAVRDAIPYATIAIGAALVLLGLAMLRGFEPMLRLPKLERGGASRELPSMFVFGVSYAVASLSCTIGTFLAVTSATFRDESLLSGVAIFVAYGLGMGSLVVFLTVATALAKTSVTRWLRRLSRHVNRISGGLLVLSGAYVTYFGVFELQLRSGVRRDPVIEFFFARQADLSRWIASVGPARLGLILAACILAALFAPVAWRRRRSAAAASATGPVAGGRDPVEAAR